MNIHSIYKQLFKIWRAKRMRWFQQTIQPTLQDTLLDVGGYPETWTPYPPSVSRIDCLNIHPVEWDSTSSPEHHITTLIGDGCQLSFPDQSYDIVFSNSVIEHVGDYPQQIAFAQEFRRVGKKLWLQTPALECPLEPHYMAPFVHWLPVSLRRKVLRWFTPWGWMTKPSQAQIDETIAFTQLLSYRQMKDLFPDCEIVIERLCLIFPKSYIAIRRTPVSQASNDLSTAN